MTRRKANKTRDFFYNLSPWLLIAACVLLLFVLTLFTVNNYQREKKLVMEALTQKGATIIRFINSSSRESMRANLRGSQDLLPWEDHAQVAMEQAVEQPGVDNVYLVDLHDQIIAGVTIHLCGEIVEQRRCGVLQRALVAVLGAEGVGGGRDGRHALEVAPAPPEQVDLVPHIFASMWRDVPSFG